MHEALGARIRSALPVDAEALALLHLDVWEDAYPALMPPEVFIQRRQELPERIERWRAQLEDPSVTTLVAQNETGLIGFAAVGPPRDDDIDIARELWGLYVRAEWWGAGIGTALLDRAIGEEAACLWVLEGNDRAIAFYRKHGFSPDRVTRTGQISGSQLRMVR